jgi:hypothetical protein
MQALFSVPQFKILPHLMLNLNNLSVKFPPYKIFLTLVFKSIARKINLKGGFRYTKTRIQHPEDRGTRFLWNTGNDLQAGILWHHKKTKQPPQVAQF